MLVLMSSSMEFHLFLIFAILCLVAVGSNAAQPAEVHWRHKLPNTPLPQELRDLLQPDMGQEPPFWDMGIKGENKMEKYVKKVDQSVTPLIWKPVAEEEDNKIEKHVEQVDQSIAPLIWKPVAEGEDNKMEKFIEQLDQLVTPLTWKPVVEAENNKMEKYMEQLDQSITPLIWKPVVEEENNKMEKYMEQLDQSIAPLIWKPVVEEKDNKMEKDVQQLDQSITPLIWKPVAEEKDEMEKHMEQLDQSITPLIWKPVVEGEDNKMDKYIEQLDQSITPLIWKPVPEEEDNKMEKHMKHSNPKNEKNKMEINERDTSLAEAEDNKMNKYTEIIERLRKSTLFFVYNDLQVGKKKTVHFRESTNKARLLPRQVADSMSLSVDNLPKIYDRFSINPESFQGKMVKQTIEMCQSPGLQIEDKYCATSLESLVDFSVKRVGDQAQILRTEVEKLTGMQEYTIMDVKFMGDKSVVCHKMQYPYAVYLCHDLKATKIYMTELVGVDGAKVKAVTPCHTNTTGMNPSILALLQINVKPGEGTVCHFIRPETLVWIPRMPIS